MSERLIAPWTREQVNALNRYQKGWKFHPYTCGTEEHENSVDLVATVNGWVCPLKCGYRQNWAHAWSVEEF